MPFHKVPVPSGVARYSIQAVIKFKKKNGLIANYISTVRPKTSEYGQKNGKIIDNRDQPMAPLAHIFISRFT